MADGMRYNVGVTKQVGSTDDITNNVYSMKALMETMNK